MRAALVAIVMVALGAQAGWADPPPAGDVEATEPDNPGTTAGSAGDPAQKAEVTLDVLRTQPQVPTVRGGTLGVPAVLGTESLQATLSTQPASSGPSTQQLPGKLGFDLFTRLGGLRLFDSLTVEILAESYHQGLPHADMTAFPVLPQMTLTEIRDVGFRAQWSAGRDSRISEIKTSAVEAAKTGIGGTVVGSVVDQFIRRHRFAVTGGVRFLQRADLASDTLDFHGASAEMIGQYTMSHVADDEACKASHVAAAREHAERASTKLDVMAAGTAPRDAARSNAKKDTESARTTLAKPLDELTDHELDSVADDLRTANQHTRVLMQGWASSKPSGDRAPEANRHDAANDANGAAANPPAQPPAADANAAAESETHAAHAAAVAASTGCKTGGYGVTFFLGWSGSLLHTEKVQDDTRNSEEPLFHELRMSFGADLRSTFTGAGTTLLPRVGAYATLSWGWWHDRFATGPMSEQDPHNFQLEGALYVSGHLLSGFDAVVSFVALKPYGHSGTQFLVNVAPAIGAVIGGK
jgi:hypothetical protein